MITPWYEKFPDRFEEERKILEAEGFSLDQHALAKERYVKFTGQAKHDGRAIQIAFPFGYPSLHPHIFDTDTSPLLARHHNPRNREFCLFGPGAGRWRASLSGKNALDEMEELLQTFSHSKEADSSDIIPEPLTEVLSYEPNSAILIPELIFEQVEPTTAEFGRGTFALRYGFFGFPREKEDIKGRGVIYKANHNGKKHQSNDYNNLINKPDEISGQLFETNRVLNPSEIQQTLKACCDIVKGKGSTFHGWICLVCKEANGDALHFRNAWLMCRVFPNGKSKLIRCYGSSNAERFSRIPGLEALSSKRVAMIGCGCLGSKISAGLASCGVGGFFLNDCDVFEPLNAVRHECGVDAFGLQKVDALARRLWSINPGLKNSIKAFSGKIGSMFDNTLDQESLQAVLACDLLIDTTGVHGVSRFLNEICYPSRIPVLYASVTNGAWGGEIFNSIPLRSPCWLCWLDQYYQQRPISGPAPAHGVFHPGCGQPSFTGTSYEAGIVANVAAWNAVEILLHNQSGRKDFSTPYLVYSGRSPEGFPLLDWRALPTESRPTCTLCGKPSLKV